MELGGLLFVAGLNCLPLVALTALAKLMHRSVVVSVLLAAVGALIYSDVWTDELLGIDPFYGFYFVFFSLAITAVVLAIGLLDIMLSRYLQRPDQAVALQAEESEASSVSGTSPTALR